MDQERYRKAVDGLSFSPDFQDRTIALLRQQAQKPEKEPLHMKRHIRKIAVVAAVAAALTISAYAAVLWLSPSQVADYAGAPRLAAAFAREDAQNLNETVQAGDYAVTLAGLVSGKGLTDWEEEMDLSHTYVVLSIRRTDGTPLDNSFDLTSHPLTPLVGGYTPWSVNNWTLGCGITGFAQDGIYYYLLDVKNLEMFADHTIYLAFYEGGAPSRDIFTMAEDGTISFAEDYKGPHALFTVPLDKRLADPAAVQEFFRVNEIDPNLYPEEDAGKDVGYYLTSEEGGDPKIIIEPGQESSVQWMTVDEFQAYMEAERKRMEQELADGILSQETFDKNQKDLENTLAGLKDGTLMAAQVDGGLCVVSQGSLDNTSISFQNTGDGVTAHINES